MTVEDHRTDVEHPPWCDGHDDPPGFDDSVHLGHPRRLTAEHDDVDLVLQLTRWDVRPDDNRPQEIGNPGAHFALVNHRLRPDGSPLAVDAFLTATDLRALARRADALADTLDGMTR